jgi:hypothetical protein
MTKRRSRLAMFRSALLAVFCLGAFSASFAHAEGEWRINGTKLAKTESLTGLVGTTEEYLFLIPASSLAIHCKYKLWIGVVLLASGESHGTYRYEECKAFTKEKELPFCDPGVIEIKFKSLLILHNKKTYLLFEPSGSSFGSVKFKEPCALAEENPIKGSYVMECVEPASCEAEVLVHPMTFASTELFPSDKLTFGASSLTVDGRDITEINGVNIGKAWSGVG